MDLPHGIIFIHICNPQNHLSYRHKTLFIVHKIQPCIKENSHSIASQSLLPVLVDWGTFLFSSSYSHFSSSWWTGDFFSSHLPILTFPPLGGLGIFSSIRSFYSHPDLLLIQHPLFQITPVLNTGLSLSEPIQLYKGYNAI